MKKYNAVSHLQFPVLRTFAELTPGVFVSVAEASKLDQRPLGSLYHRGWLAYRPGRGFFATKAGRDAYDEYLGNPRHRLRATAPLSHYFDPIASEIKRPEHKLKVVA